MDNSIERIWKKGFADESAFVPRIENLQDLKSIYFMDQFKRRYQINVVILALTAVFVLLAFVAGGVPIIGIFMFLLFAVLAILGKLEINKLDQLDKGASNYEFISSFDDWLKSLLVKFSLIYRIWVPLLFLGFSLALLHTQLFVPFIGETLVERFAGESFLPAFWYIGLLVPAALLSYFSNHLFKMEMATLYGDLISRLDDLLNELDGLK